VAKPTRTRIYSGVPVAQGVAVGPAKLVNVSHFPAQVPHYRIEDHDIEREVHRLRKACREARKELAGLAAKVRARLGRREADLIHAQALMVEDPAFVAEVEELIIERRLNAEAAVATVMERFTRLVEGLHDQYLRERGTDIRDAGRRILGKLLFAEGGLVPRFSQPSIVVASHLVPSLTVHLEREKILGFATERGGFTSHAAILARSLNIPAVTGVEGISDDVVDGETIIVDGMKGQVIVRPSHARVDRYREAALRFRVGRERLIAEAKAPAVTRDGTRVSVLANVGRPQEVPQALEYQAEGIGLYRTEFDFLGHASLPSEDDLAREYGNAAQAFGERGVVLRVLDIGGDKFPPSVPLAHEENPYMGMRGLRLLLTHVEDLMLPQMRAIIRAGARGRVSVLYPMVTSVEGLEAAKECFERAKAQLRERGVNIDREPQQGIMIEVPSCVSMLPELLRRCDFATVGTNDLIQYLLAADRNSERMVEAYDAFNPAVVRILNEIRRVAEQENRPVSVCGEVASDVAFIPLLLGLGYRVLSVNVGAIPHVKQAVRKMDLGLCRDLARSALSATTNAEIHRAVEEFRRRYGTRE